jgi:hypothetical protein
MTHIILEAKNKKEADLLLEIAHRMNIKGKKMSLELMEDIAFANAIDEGRKTKKVSRAVIMKSLKS